VVDPSGFTTEKLSAASGPGPAVAVGEIAASPALAGGLGSGSCSACPASVDVASAGAVQVTGSAGPASVDVASAGAVHVTGSAGAVQAAGSAGSAEVVGSAGVAEVDAVSSV